MFLRIMLPSGRSLSYPSPRLATDKFGNAMVVFKDNAAGKWVDCRHGHGAYGGLWTENIVQAISRDLLAAAMQRLEAAGYPIVLHVHDEIVAEAPIEFGSLEEFQRLITTLPDWAAGLPIAAKVRNGERFSKSEKPAPTPQTDYHDEINAGLKREGIEPINWEALSARCPDSGGPEITHQRPFVSVEPKVEHDPPVEISKNSNDSEDLDTTEASPKINGASANNYPHGERRAGRRLATYLYRDHLKGNHTRVEKWRSSTATRTQYPQFFWSGGRWVSQKPKNWTKVPYRLPELLEALAKDPGTDVFVPEGEKDADTIAALGLIATTNSEGATPLKAKIGKWAPELSRWFHGVRRLFILADNDEVGRAFAQEKARTLAGIVGNICIVLFPDVPEGEDVTWWLKHQHTKEELIARCESAPPWQSAGVLESVRASDVKMEAIDWLWPGRFALGKLGILAGLPDEGKSSLLCYIAGRLTNAELEWPNGEGYPPRRGSVILLTSEDAPADTLVPRLAAANADLNRIEIVQMVHDRDVKDGRERQRMFSMANDLGLLRHKIEELGDVIAIEIDPVTAYLGTGKDGVDSFRDTDVRAVLGPLVHLASEHRIAIIAIMHFNKKIDVTNALLRISNSLAFGGVARHVFAITKDETNARRLMARAKNNIASEANNKTLAFHFETRQVGKDWRDGRPIEAPFIVFDPGYVDVTATEALLAVNQNKSPGVLDDAKEFLRDILVAGGGHAPKIDIEDAAEAEKITAITLRRAKKALKIRAEKERSPTGKWYWVLPDETLN
jgi:hypothetical protein